MFFVTASCSYKQFFASVTSRGGVPYEKTYYISHDMGDEVDYLEFKDYSQLLQVELASLGYRERDTTSAYLDIHLNYGLGTKEVVSTTSTQRTYNITNSTWNVKSNKSTTARVSGWAAGTSTGAVGAAYGKSNTKTNTKISNNTFSYGGGSTTTTNEDGFPCYMVIEAFNTINKLPEWKVEVEGFIPSPAYLPKVMPWMMLVAKWHIGKRYSGIVEVETDKFLYQLLPDVFNSTTWSLQYHYFGGSDVVYKEDPIKVQKNSGAIYPRSVNPKATVQSSNQSNGSNIPMQAATLEQRESKIWLVPSEPEVIDLESYLSKYESIYLQQKPSLAAGDVVYFYLVSPISSVKYKCIIEEAELSYTPEMDIQEGFYKDGEMYDTIKKDKKFMRLKLIATSHSDSTSLPNLRVYGITKDPQACLNLSHSIYTNLREYIEQAFIEAAK